MWKCAKEEAISDRTGLPGSGYSDDGKQCGAPPFGRARKHTLPNWSLAIPNTEGESMKRRPTHGVFVISIDVAGDSTTVSGSRRSTVLADAAATLDAAKWLLQLLDQYRLPATWFLAGPGTSVLRTYVIGADVRHEVGLLVSENGRDSSRRLEFRQNLQRRVFAARAAGIEVTSLALKTPWRIENLDLLVKHGIRAIRAGRGPTIDSARPTGWGAVSTLRFGISSLPTTLEAVESPRWQRWIKAWENRRHIGAAARHRQYCHLTLDIRTLVGSGPREALRQTLRVASRLVVAERIQAQSMSQVATCLMARPSTPPAQSILRAA
jgi:hypothetical protein